jgi:hypothetical protein
MELVRRSGSHAQRGRIAIHFQLPLYLRFMLSLSLGISAMVACILTLTRFMQPSPNPFASFADVFPGQPRSAIEARGFSCALTPYPTYAEACIYWPKTGDFSLVRIAFSSPDAVSSISFGARDNTLRLGDLVALWGRPEVHKYGRSTYFFWFDGRVTGMASADVERVSLFSPVASIRFENPPT